MGLRRVHMGQENFVGGQPSIAHTQSIDLSVYLSINLSIYSII